MAFVVIFCHRISSLNLQIKYNFQRRDNSFFMETTILMYDESYCRTRPISNLPHVSSVTQLWTKFDNLITRASTWDTIAHWHVMKCDARVYCTGPCITCVGNAHECHLYVARVRLSNSVNQHFYIFDRNYSLVFN